MTTLAGKLLLLLPLLSPCAVEGGAGGLRLLYLAPPAEAVMASSLALTEPVPTLPGHFPATRASGEVSRPCRRRR